MDKSKSVDILSVEELLRKDSGYYGVKGLIVGASSVEHIIESTEFGCSNCMKKTKKPDFVMKHDPPLFSKPQRVNKCPTCESQSYGPRKYNNKQKVMPSPCPASSEDGKSD
jgi:hypothetical protein